MSMIDEWLATKKYGRSSGSVPRSTSSRAAAARSKPGAHKRRAMASGTRVEPVSVRARSARLMQPALHASVNTSCTAFKTLQPKRRKARLAPVAGSTGKEDGATLDMRGLYPLVA